MRKSAMFMSQLVLLAIITLVLASVSYGGDPTPAAVIPAIPAAPSFTAWLVANENPILKALLLITEAMALFPFFKGNGIVDSIIKCLKFLVEKPGSDTAGS